jgi:hypothetical protein
LRALLADAGLPPGWYLVGAAPEAADLDAAQLRSTVAALVERITP